MKIMCTQDFDVLPKMFLYFKVKRSSQNLPYPYENLVCTCHFVLHAA